jgi:isoleucyl-tRNA synthetase
MGSPVMNGEDILISEDHYRDQVRCFMLILWNVYNFFVTYARTDKWFPKKASRKNLEVHLLDKWMMIRLKELKIQVKESLEKYSTVSVVNSLSDFVNDLSRWYIRRSRGRVGPTADISKDKLSFYYNCYYILVELSKISAPVIPFLSEEIFRNLTGKRSVHLEDWPEGKKLTIQDEKIVKEMALLRKIVERAHAKRKEHNIPLRQPLNAIHIKTNKQRMRKSYLDILKDEVNVERVKWVKGKELSVNLNTKITPRLKLMLKARELVRLVQVERRNQGLSLEQKIIVTNPWIPSEKELVEYIKKRTLALSLEKGKFKVIITS